MMNFKVDRELCVNCGLCSSDCPVLIIDRKTEFPSIIEGKEEHCLKCQHCLAICPEGAISIWGKKPKDSLAVPETHMGSEDLEVLIQTRRSVRRYSKHDVAPELIQRLVSVAAYAPTAKNENAVKMTVIASREQMTAIREKSYRAIADAFEKELIPPSKEKLNNFRELWDSKRVDIIFRNAPHMLICSAPKNATLPETDGTIAMSYFELLANSNGLGTLWNGFAKNLFEERIFDMYEVLGIPEDHVISSVMVFGYPRIAYARSIQY